MTPEIQDFVLTKDELIVTYTRCIENVTCLLRSAKLLLGQAPKQYSLGLYMYAVEEFGKAQLLKAHTSSYSIPTWIFGRRSFRPESPHDAKLAEGFKNLPEDCQIICVGLRFISNNSEKARTYTVGRNFKVNVPPLATGFYSDVTGGSKIEFDFKTACFYIDWDQNNKAPSFEIEVDAKQLENNIILFEKSVEKYLVF